MVLLIGLCASLLQPIDANVGLVYRSDDGVFAVGQVDKEEFKKRATIDTKRVRAAQVLDDQNLVYWEVDSKVFGSRLDGVGSHLAWDIANFERKNAISVRSWSVAPNAQYIAIDFTTIEGRGGYGVVDLRSSRMVDSFALNPSLVSSNGLHFEDRFKSGLVFGRDESILFISAPAGRVISPVVNERAPQTFKVDLVAGSFEKVGSGVPMAFNRKTQELTLIDRISSTGSINEFNVSVFKNEVLQLDRSFIATKVVPVGDGPNVLVARQSPDRAGSIEIWSKRRLATFSTEAIVIAYGAPLLAYNVPK